MSLNNLSEDEKNVVLQCLIAIRDGPFIHPLGFHPRLGLEREELAEIVARWPHVDDTIETSRESIALNNCIATALNTYAIRPEEWPRWFSVPREEVKRVYEKWRGPGGLGASEED